MKSILNIAILIIGFFPFFSGIAVADRQQSLDKMRKINLIYQVYLGRGAYPRELRDSLARSSQDVADELVKQKEFQDLFACRVHSFFHGGQQVDSKNCPALSNVGSGVSLEEVLRPLSRKDHRICQKEASSVCFSSWLMDRVAPLQKANFMEKNKSRLSTASYAELLSLMINE
jgi:hypothetical protein